MASRRRRAVLRFDFHELPGDPSALARPVLSVRVEDLVEASQLCLIDTGSLTNRFPRWVADEVGVELGESPGESVTIAGVTTSAWHSRVDLTIAGVRYDAPVTFCDPWPFAFGILGQEGFFRFFRVTICAKEFWLDVEPEASG